MTDRNDYYVYEHWRPDLDICFYVGNGCGRRARRNINRNEHYKRVVRKLKSLGMCIEIKMYASGLTEAQALSIEVERIAFWRGIGVDLTNKTAGGDGCPAPTPDVREKMRAAQKKRWLVADRRREASEKTKIAWKSDDFRNAVIKSKIGKSPSAETRKKMSLANKGQKRSAEVRAKMSAAQMGNKKGLGKRGPVGNSFRLGTKHTEEARAKMRASQQARHRRALEPS